jgi:hypothetical protein
MVCQDSLKNDLKQKIQRKGFKHGEFDTIRSGKECLNGAGGGILKKPKDQYAPISLFPDYTFYPAFYPSLMLLNAALEEIAAALNLAGENCELLVVPAC